jgi:ABC-2 type transport system ATP-binding protein
MIILEVKNLVKHYGSVKAVDDISFTVQEGQCFGLLGPNGAGKTTTIEIIETILKPDRGQIFYKDNKISNSFKEKIGIQFQNTALQEYLTVKETLTLFSRLYPKPKSIDEIVKICSLEDIIDRDNRKLSGGQKQRMLLGIALINDPELIFLDEPTTGLDPHARRNFWNLIEKLKSRKKTVFLTTHYMDEAEILCDEIVIIDHGKIIEKGNPEILLHKYFDDAVIKLPLDNIQGDIKLPCDYVKERGFLKINCSDIDAVVKALIKMNVSLTGLVIEKPNLDDLFIKLTGASLRD